MSSFYIMGDVSSVENSVVVLLLLDKGNVKFQELHNVSLDMGLSFGPFMLKPWQFSLM